MACTLADIMRAYAPDAPYEGETVKVRESPAFQPAPVPRADAMRQFPTGQLDSTTRVLVVLNLVCGTLFGE